MSVNHKNLFLFVTWMLLSSWCFGKELYLTRDGEIDFFSSTPIEDIKAVNPVAIDLKEISSLADFMVIASGTSNRHIAAISERIIEGLREEDISGIKIEGQVGDDWLLVDAGDVIVHLMSSEAREFYDLESLWDPEL